MLVFFFFFFIIIFTQVFVDQLFHWIILTVYSSRHFFTIILCCQSQRLIAIFKLADFSSEFMTFKLDIFYFIFLFRTLFIFGLFCRSHIFFSIFRNQKWCFWFNLFINFTLKLFKISLVLFFAFWAISNVCNLCFGWINGIIYWSQIMHLLHKLFIFLPISNLLRLNLHHFLVNSCSIVHNLLHTRWEIFLNLYNLIVLGCFGGIWFGCTSGDWLCFVADWDCVCSSDEEAGDQK